ncbi:MAG: DNA-directed RNA polymerase subunit alpha [Dehalococcoidales bacterium]|nr:DNA-directed RNA polymerase subunit alpha [Dehalococcoidales bacterium]
MSRLVIPKIDCAESENNFGRFTAEPLERGFGVTLGNALRRVLFGYLPGAAVTQVRVEGIRHEFTTIPHAKEDVTEFLLNVKAMRIKPLSGQPGKLILDVQGEGQVCAADIKPSTDFEITNPETNLVILDSPEAKLYIEFDIELGEGYRTAESNDSMPVGTIPVDAIFSPIRNVNFTTEPIHAGRETSHERLVIEVWTDGTTTPVDAISRAAGILVEQLSPFVSYVKVSQMKAEEQLIRLSIPDEKYNMPVEQLDLSVRTMNCLRRGGIATVGELISKKSKDLLQLRNFGQKSYREIEERLKELGLSLTPPPGLMDETAPEEASPEEADATIDTSEETEPQSGEAEDEA